MGIRCKSFEGILCRLLKNNKAKCSHKECTIHELIRLFRSAVVENSVFFVVFVSEESCKLSGEPMYHSKVEWTKILIKWKVCKVFINVEEKCIFEVLWWLTVGHPIQFIYILSEIRMNFAKYLKYVIMPKLNVINRLFLDKTIVMKNLDEVWYSLI